MDLQEVDVFALGQAEGEGVRGGLHGEAGDGDLFGYFGEEAAQLLLCDGQWGYLQFQCVQLITLVLEDLVQIGLNLEIHQLFKFFAFYDGFLGFELEL